MSDAREQADRMADRVRDDLLSTLEELDRRRLQATDWRSQLEQHRQTLLIVAGGVGAAVLVAVGLAFARHQWADRHLVQRRWKGLRRAWEHPERIASRAGEAPVLQQILRKALVAFGVALAVRAGKRAATAMVPTTPSRPVGEPYLS